MSGRGASRQGRVACVVVLLGMLSGCASTPRVTQTDRLQAQAAYERGVQHLTQREWAAALIALRQANSFDPTVAVYHDAVGIAYLQIGQPGIALTEFRRATELDRDLAEAHVNAGIALAEMARWTDAVESYQRAIASPRLTVPDTAHHNLGLALYHLGRHLEAEGALRFALSLDPAMESGWFHLGLVLVATGRRDEARAAFRKAQELAPSSPFGQAALERLKALGDGG